MVSNLRVLKYVKEKIPSCIKEVLASSELTKQNNKKNNNDRDTNDNEKDNDNDNNDNNIFTLSVACGSAKLQE